MISNVNIGLLEKGTNKSQKSLVFDTRAEALYHQNVYGGTTNKISGFYSDEVLTEMTDEYIKELERIELCRNKGEGMVLEFDPHGCGSGEYQVRYGKFRYFDDGSYEEDYSYYHEGYFRIIDGKYYDI